MIPSPFTYVKRARPKEIKFQIDTSTDCRKILYDCAEINRCGDLKLRGECNPRCIDKYNQHLNIGGQTQ